MRSGTGLCVRCEVAPGSKPEAGDGGARNRVAVQWVGAGQRSIGLVSLHSADSVSEGQNPDIDQVLCAPLPVPGTIV